MRKTKSSTKVHVQRLGRFLSGMVMPNIGAFITWGLITAMFIDVGWFPNQRLAALVDPMKFYLLPLLIAYTGGSLIHGIRGGVVGAIAVMGMIVGSADVAMFLGAMIVGPLGGWVIKKFDKLTEPYHPVGFEMLINNFSAGIIGGILAILAIYLFTPVVIGLTNSLEAAVEFFIVRGILPLVSLFIEPAKILFLNNAINHGVLTPLGTEQAKELGKSVLYLLESNPGPGLGVLLAYLVFGKGSVKDSTPGSIVIHFFGGIHEIYFPYVLMNPLLVIAVIAGGASGVLTFTIFGAGTVGPPAPGSIIALMAVAPKGGHLAILAGVAVAAAVSFLVSMPLVRRFSARTEGDDTLEKARSQVKSMKKESKGQTVSEPERAAEPVKKIVFACDAGMGSSAMGANRLKKKLKAAGLGDIAVEHASVDDIPGDAQLVISHKNLSERAKQSAPQARHYSITNFLNAPEYDEIVAELKQ